MLSRQRFRMLACLKNFPLPLSSAPLSLVLTESFVGCVNLIDFIVWCWPGNVFFEVLFSDIGRYVDLQHLSQ